MFFTTIRRYLFIAVVAVLAAFVVLVQRDTFVRRWLLPTPAGRAKLEQVLPQIEITDATLPEAAANLSRMAGVEIDVEPEVDLAPQSESPKYSLRLKNVTLARTLQLLIDQNSAGGKYPCAVAQGDRVRIVSQDAADAALVFRVYDVSDLLPPPGVTSTKVMAGSLYQGPISSVNPTPATDRELAVDGLLGLMEGLLPEIPAASPTPAGGRQASTLFANSTGPCVMMNDKLIVVAPEWAQARIAELLAGVRRSGGGLFRPLQ